MNWRLLLLPVSVIYALVATIRNIFFDVGIFKQQSFKTPVILVGNLSVGGTGKTPHVEYLISILNQSNKLATLSRGYGRKSNGFVMAGKGVTATEIGDEPMQYYVKNSSVTVSVCESRVEGINKLLNLKQPPEVIIMDDGYQHRNVKPGFSILLTTYDNCFTNDYVLPAGNLRELRSGYKRANCIIVTKVPDTISLSQKQDVQIAINPLPHQSLFFSSIKYGNPVSFFKNNELHVDKLATYNVILFTGIASPAPLIKYLEDKTLSLVSLAFPDHHEYTAKDAKAIIEKVDNFAREKTIVLTTEKDYLRMYGTPLMEQFISLPCYFIPVTVKIENPDAFNKLIFEAVNTL